MHGLFNINVIIAKAPCYCLKGSVMYFKENNSCDVHVFIMKHYKLCQDGFIDHLSNDCHLYIEIVTFPLCTVGHSRPKAG